jgi:hypothetical protein
MLKFCALREKVKEGAVLTALNRFLFANIPGTQYQMTLAQ